MTITSYLTNRKELDIPKREWVKFFYFPRNCLHPSNGLISSHLISKKSRSIGPAANHDPDFQNVSAFSLCDSFERVGYRGNVPEALDNVRLGFRLFFLKKKKRGKKQRNKETKGPERGFFQRDISSMDPPTVER